MDIAEHSMCHPGNPSPQGLGHFKSLPGSAFFHSVKSLASRFSGSTSTRTASSSSAAALLPDSLP